MDRTRYVSRSFVNMPHVTYVERRLSPMYIRTVERLPAPTLSTEGSEYWKEKYERMRKKYQHLKREYKGQVQSLQQSKHSEIKQISDLFHQSQNDIQQLKTCLSNVDKQLNEDYKLKYEQVRKQLEQMNYNYQQLQQRYEQNHQFYEDFATSKLSANYAKQELQEKDSIIHRQKDQIAKLLAHIQSMENQLIPSQDGSFMQETEKLHQIIEDQERQIKELQLRYTQLFNHGTKLQDQLGLFVLHYAEIESLRFQISEKEYTIQQLRNQLITQYKM